jgi:uncharacterized protein with PhoU and TrkA domain
MLRENTARSAKRSACRPGLDQALLGGDTLIVLGELARVPELSAVAAAG